MAEESKKRNKNYCRVTCIFDMEGFSIKEFTWKPGKPLLWIIKALVFCIRWTISGPRRSLLVGNVIFFFNPLTPRRTLVSPFTEISILF